MTGDRELELGLFLTPDATDHERVLEQALAAERAGLDLIGIQDHPYQPRFLDTWTLIANLLGRTERIRIFPDVANLPLRPPAMLAKAAASLDLLSGGRVELGLGAGASSERIAGMGVEPGTVGERVGAVEEAIGILRRAWAAAGPLRHRGGRYRLDYEPGPRPAHPIGIWVGAYGPRMLELTGRLADGWVPSLGYMPPDELAEARERVDEAAASADRDPSEVVRLYNVRGTIRDAPQARGPLDGPPEQWIETLAGWAADLGIDAFVLSPTDGSIEQIERFGGEVGPAVRAAARSQARA